MKIVQLYNTSEYSFLDSLIKLEELVKQSKENGLKAVALTDHNNMFGLGPFLELCNKYEIKPILGVDLDVEKYRFILLAKNYEGFQFINSLILQKSQGKTIRIENLRNDNIFLLDHPIYGLYATEKNNSLVNAGNYFINSKNVNLPNAIFIRENKLFSQNDNEALQTLQKIGGSNEFRFYEDYFAELDLDEIIIDRMNFIVEQCNVTFPPKKLNLAQFNNNSDEDNFELFKTLLQNGLNKKSAEIAPFKNWEDRLNYEIEIIQKFKFVNYFLIIQDLVNWAKAQDIAIGPGRGSAAGSLVSYLLGITEINPLKYDLLFERFLNPGRSSWPDIDIDIQDDRRYEVFEYLKNKYGFERTALISTFQTIGAKMAIRDVARVIEQNISSVEINKISKLLDPNLTLEQSYLSNRLFRSEVDKYPGLYELAKKIEGLPRQQSFHPAGFIIANNPINSIVPTCLSNDNLYQQVQLSMNYTEDFGLLKIDLLGLKTLTEIKQIESYLPKDQLFDNILAQYPQAINDPKTFNMLNNGFTEGIFQLESPGMKKTINKVVIQTFDDLYAIISLFRPGPVKYIDDYVKGKNDPKSIPIIHPIYDRIVRPTFGIIVYQEQIMLIAQEVANFSSIEADFLRRAISKKHDDEIAMYEGKFIEGAIKNGLTPIMSKEIYKIIQRFGLYGFNKSHAVSYAYSTMKMAFYKTYYPMYYYAALISNSQGSQDTIHKYALEAEQMGFAIHSPNILHSTNKCEIIDNQFYLPLNMIKGFGNEGVNKILIDKQTNGEYPLNLTEILIRLRFAGIKDAMMETLIKANVFRQFGPIKYIMQCDKRVKDIYNSFANYDSFAQAKEKIAQLGFFTMVLANPKSKEFEDLEYETACEIQTLGQVYNVYLTKKFEAQYPNRLINLVPGTPKAWYVCEVIKTRLNKEKHYFLLEVKDSTKSIAFWLNDNNAEYYEDFKVGKVFLIEAEHSKRFKNPKLLNWKAL
ncbi:DNA polymerase III subunit alpha [Mycoplasmopsis iners]|uniref:DNA polymerase III subunit alpha n=1 Tax=Mycoplasmopsis iners TaxID=76630 RepID=UPI000495A6CD|nr:DNA polymerase III subunit alpha [Mycoplasmopsis iners]